MFSFDYNLSQSYQVAQLRHEMFLRELKDEQRQARLARSIMAEVRSERRFRLMYRVRRMMHRMVPGLARMMF